MMNRNQAFFDMIIKVISVFVLATAWVSAADTSCSPMEKYHEVSTGVYVRQGIDGITFSDHSIANIGFIVGESCVAVIDTGGSKREGENLKCAIENATDSPICYVINTHVHPDHIMGNRVFVQDGISFIGHKLLPQAMSLSAETYLRRASRYENRSVTMQDIIPPNLIVEDTLEIDLGNRQLTIKAHGISHTNNDLSIYDSKTRTLWLSDLLFTTHTPVLTGSLSGWLQTLDTLTKQQADRVIPGHGPITAAWPEAADMQINYLRAIRVAVKKAIDEGTSLLKVQETLMKENIWRWTLYDEMRKRNVINAYAELEWE